MISGRWLFFNCKEKFDRWAEEEDRSLSYLGSKIIEKAIAEREQQQSKEKNKRH